MEKENEKLKLELLRAKKKIKLEQTGAPRSGTPGTESAMQREVKKCAKNILWKVCKFLKNDAKLSKATKYVMETLVLSEHEGLEGAELIEAQEVWKKTCEVDVRTALNRQRNYVQQELREVMEEECFQKNMIEEFPNEEQILDVVLRIKLDDQTPEAERLVHEKLFDNYWNVLIPKVAGHSHWGPSKRHHELMSFGKEDPKDKKCQCYVTASDEAFLAMIWLNCYKKWAYKHKCKVENREPDEKDPEMQTPYTNSKVGQKKFGGWTDDGILKYLAVLNNINENRDKQKKYLQDVEQEALDRIRVVEKVDEKEAKRKTKKRKAAGKSKFADEEDDEEDYENW